jgi:hypothetical protein
MRFRRKLEEPDESIELNLIPLIDIIMFLLIFFISTTSFIEEPGVPVNKAACRQRETDGQEQHHFRGHLGWQDCLWRQGDRAGRRATDGETALRQRTAAGRHPIRREFQLGHGHQRD